MRIERLIEKAATGRRGTERKALSSGYHSANNNEVIAPQIAAQSPSDRSSVTIKAVPVSGRNRGHASRTVGPVVSNPLPSKRSAIECCCPPKPPIIWCAPILVNLKRMPVSPRSPCYKKLGGTGFGGPDSAGKLGFPPSPWNRNTATALIQRGF